MWPPPSFCFVSWLCDASASRRPLYLIAPERPSLPLRDVGVLHHALRETAADPSRGGVVVQGDAIDDLERLHQRDRQRQQPGAQGYGQENCRRLNHGV